MRKISGEVLESSVDWITATSCTKSSAGKMEVLGKKLLRMESRAGNDTKPWGFAGYTGFKCGSVQLGNRPDGYCMRLSSGVAAENWHKLYQAADGFSRVDIQATIKGNRDPQQETALAYKQALRWSNKRAHGPAVTLLRSNNGTSTVYLGKRISDTFGRIYDKGRESGLDHYRNATRFEVEIKGRACIRLLTQLHRSQSPNSEVARHVFAWFARRGILYDPPAEDKCALSAPRKRSDNERRLLWIETQCRPSIMLLIQAGYRERLLDMLGFSLQKSDAKSKLQMIKSA